MSVFTAISIAMLLMIAGIVIDVGSLYFARRSLQSTDDAAALAAVQNPSSALSVAQSVFAQNGYSGETLTVDTGVYTPDENLTAEQRFVVSNTNVNAVRVRANIKEPGYFTTLFGLSKLIPLTTQSTAARLPTASFGAGTRLAELDNGILNNVLGGLWGSHLSLTLVDYNSLVDTNIDALTFLDQLATDIHVTGTYAQLANANVTVGQLIQALVEATTEGVSNGDTTAALLALKALQSQVNSNISLKVSDIINMTPLLLRTIGGIKDDENGLKLNLMSVLSASARDSAASGTINLGAALTVPITNTSIATRIAIGNKMAQVADAQVGDTIHTGQIRAAVTATITNLNLIVATVTVQIPLYLEAATGQAQLTSMPCVPGGTLANITASSGVASLGFGTVSDSALSNFSVPVTPVSGPIINVSLLGIPVAINAAGSAGATGSGPSTLPFAQSDIDAGTIKSPTANVALFSNLGAGTTLSATILGNPGLLANTLNGLINQLLTNLKPVVSNLLTQLNAPVNTLLTTLGLQLGTIDVRVFDTECRTPTLVE
ncbi:MAG TPA: pilus assembly protein TadG-related protein [Rhizomicrobium sp.]|nr:pilus assembly protein TadG-related protein [Rhizomicrobium sp.]